MLRYYHPAPIGELRLGARNERLRAMLLCAPKAYSETNAEITLSSLRETEGQPVILQRAKVLRALFEKMPVYLRDGELLAGNRSEGLGIMPRLPSAYAAEESPRANPDDARADAVGIYGNYAARLSPEAKAAENCLLAGYPAGSVAGFGHILADYGMIVREGAFALADKAERYARDFAAQGKAKEQAFCEASAIACRSFGNWGRRYAALAREQAIHCSDAERRRELEELAAVCEQVPALPARSFREALQAIFFAHQAMAVEQQGGSISIGGFDRLLFPFYAADMAGGVLSVAAATELVEGFYIKLMENAIWPREVVNFCNLTVGGSDKNGNDLSNDLTWLALDTLVKTRSTHPLVSFRWHPNVDRDLWKRAVAAVGIGTGLPAFFSDPKMTASLESWNIPGDIVHEYGVVGCVEPALNGLVHGQTLGGHINLILCLELAINGGKRFGHKEQVGPATEIPCDPDAFDGVWKAYQIQVRHACGINRDSVYAVADAQREMFGYPLMSSLMHSAVEAGRDLTDGAQYDYPTVCVTGVTNVVDSLLSLRELLADGYSFETLRDVLLRNYDGYDELRAKILSSRKRFGNGSPEFVELYNRVCEIHTSVITAMPGPRGGHFAPGLWTTTWHVSQGRYTGASLDGRLAGSPIADCAGPVSGRPVNSPTAMARDMAGIDAVRHYSGGYVFNQKFSSGLFRDGEQLEKIAAYIETFFLMGGMQMQINVHSRKLLEEAKRNPEEHKDLVVRVAGFSAYFVALDSGVQDEIISRAQVEV